VRRTDGRFHAPRWTAIYESARGKIADCLVNGKRLLIAGGSYRLCGEDGPRMACECWQEIVSESPIIHQRRRKYNENRSNL
jgi:hypothetical protein